MIPPEIGLVVGVIVGVILGWLVGHALDDGWFFYAVFILLLGICAGLVGVAVGGVTAARIGGNSPTHYVEKSRTTLVTLHDAAGIEGRWWFLGGELNSTTKYTYYFETPYGYQHGEIDTNDPDVYIKMDAAPGTGYIAIERNEFVNPSDGTWGIPSGDDHTVIHIPPGSILPNFHISN